jgi:hypothetical protein
MGLGGVLAERFQRIGCGLPPFEADHLGNCRGHLDRQLNDFAHEERPCAGVGVKRGRGFDLGVSGRCGLCLCGHLRIGAIPPRMGRLLGKLETSGPHSKLYAFGQSSSRGDRRIRY